MFMKKCFTCWKIAESSNFYIWFSWHIAERVFQSFEEKAPVSVFKLDALIACWKIYNFFSKHTGKASLKRVHWGDENLLSLLST